MKYFKYSILILLWLLIKSLSLVIAFSIIWLWIYLVGINTWWSYLLAFSPTIIIYGFSIIDWIKKKYSKETCRGTTAFEDVAGMLLIVSSLFPCILISLLIIMICFVGIKFPSKYDLEGLKKDSAFKRFVKLCEFV
jgi:hypothetical protein